MKTSAAKSFYSKWVMMLLYLTTLMIISESCAFTWIGRAAGGDIGRPGFNDLSDGRIIKVSSEKINYGGKNHVEVHKIDSTVVFGKFQGFSAIPFESYNLTYNRFLEVKPSLIPLPFLGEMLMATFINHKVQKITGSFEGFYPEGIRIKSGNTALLLPISKILCLNNTQGLEYDLQVMQGLLDSNKVPLNKGILILSNFNQKIIIPIEEIAYARCQKSERNGKLIGTAVGALIDLTIILVKTKDSFTENAIENKF